MPDRAELEAAVLASLSEEDLRNTRKLLLRYVSNDKQLDQGDWKKPEEWVLLQRLEAAADAVKALKEATDG